MLTEEQQAAIEKILEWIATNKTNFFVLKGSAGTGKSYCMRALASQGGNFAYTAPTNKATKVLRESVITEDYQPLCKTIYSLLGLTLGKDGEVKELKATKKFIDLSEFTAVIIDEASMISKQLFQHIEMAAIKSGARFLFLGDAAQLPPINEAYSKVWEIGDAAELTKVMRYDNAILELATRLRDQVDADDPYTKLSPSNDGVEGIWREERSVFEAMIRDDAKKGLFSIPNTSKVIAWRNIRVLQFNEMIRNTIFSEPNTPAWTPGDRILFASAVKDENGFVLASVDDEGTVRNTAIEYLETFKVWSLEVELDDSRVVYATALHADSLPDYEEYLRFMLEEIREKKARWKDFWDFKEMFHDVKYAYAITAHRAQGSTYETAYVCWQDILRNSNKNEAYRCLYVACTRPKTKLILS